MTYTLFIDESGDEGIEDHQISRGASPLFFLGGFLIKEQDIQATRNVILRSRQRLNKEFLHYNSLKHEQKVFFANRIAECSIVCFGVVSDKAHLVRGNYGEMISGESYKFYNKNIVYMLEMVGEYCTTNEISVNSVILEERAKMQYSKLQNFVSAIRSRPLHARARFLKHFPPQNIAPLPKQEEPLLEIADALANSLHRSCIPNIYGDVETTYLNRMKNLFPTNNSGKIAGKGIIAVRNFYTLNAPQESRDFLINLQVNAIAISAQTSA